MEKRKISNIQKELWQMCRQIAHKIYPPENGVYKCYTCSKPIEGSNKQLGHFIPSSTCGAFLRYSMRNLRFQCYHCNINCGGQGAEFYRRLVRDEGQEYVDQLFIDKEKIVKAYDFYLDTIENYKKML